MRRNRSNASWTQFGRLGTRPVAALVAVALVALAATVTSVDRALAYSVGPSGGEPVALLSPAPAALADEGSIILSWEKDASASEYVVFVSTASIDGRTAESLLDDDAVARTTTKGASIALQDVLRGPEGTTEYWWAVAARDAESGALRLSDGSTFRAIKSFVGGSPPSPIVVEAGRGLAAVEPYEDATSLLFANGLRFDPIAEGEPEIPAALRATALREDEVGTFIVQLRGPVREGQREDIAGAGGALFAYLPNYAFVVRMGAERKASVEALPFVRWVGSYHPAYKISAQREMSEPAGTRTLSVLLYPDADLEAARAAFVALGGTVLEATDSGRNKMLRVSIDMSRVADMVGRNDVAWLEPWHEMVLDNSTTQWITQTNVSNSRRVWDMGIHGEGQIVLTVDSGIRTSHNMFRDPAVTISNFGDFPTHRKIIAYVKSHEASTNIVFGDAAGAAYHGTHTAGTVAGDDSYVGAADARDGMALKSKIYFMDAGASANTISVPGDLNPMFQQAYGGNAGGAPRISSNSWGADNSGAYDLQEMTVDQFTWDHKDFLICFSNGNAGGANTVGTPAGAKNAAGAGGTNNPTATNIYTATSRGPTDDGRRKPLVCAPANPLSSAAGSSDTGFQSLSGTSMSCPAIAGSMTLIRQYFMDGWYPTGAAVPGNAFTPSAALLKAAAIASTENDMSGFTIPDNNVGWGRINVDNALYFAGDTRRLAAVDETGSLATGEFVDYEINVTDASVALKIALAWTDYQGNPAAGTQLVNNLDLTVTEPNGTTVYKGNVFAGGQSTTGGSSDALNVEECVRRTTPALGVWTVRVTGTNVPFGPQPYGLVITGGMGQNNGIVRLDRGTYGQSDLIEVRVEDLNASSPITVNLASTTESTPEALSIAGPNGVFVGTIGTTAVSASGGDGLLSVSHGDAITATYSDASPVANVDATAVADFTGPVITNVRATNGPDESVIITWTTDILSDSRVYFGTAPFPLPETAEEAGVTTSHQLVVTNVAPDTSYYFDVESVDRGGNVTRDDRGGAHYRFTTGHRSDVLLVIGDNTFPNEALYTAALDNLGWDYAVHHATNGEPAVGDKTSGMRSYKAVWWQVGYEQYPPLSNTARDSIAKYHDGGGRFSIVSHDVGWAFSDATSGYFTNPRLTWLGNYLHITFQFDPTTWSSIVGVAADPISGAYTGGIPYVPWRDGAAGDEINPNPGTGTSSMVWLNNDVTPDHIALRWTSGANNGSPDSAVWGGTPTKLVYNGLEWAQMTDVAARQDVLDKTLIWLIGRDHPDVTITSPAPASVVTTNTTSIAWTEAVYGGASVASRKIYYSSDDGSSWNLVTSSPGTSPYSWDVSALPNGTEYLVDVVITDDGAPALAGGGTPDPSQHFTINRAGGDTRGPVVVAGSITSGPNPMNNAGPSTLSATVTDLGRGTSNIVAAEWSYGTSPASPGSGYPMTGVFTTPTVAASGTVLANTVPAGSRTFWVRGRDAAGNWGSASPLVVVVNGVVTGIDAASTLPGKYGLEQNWPNPFNPKTTIRYALPKGSLVELAVYNASGEKVRTLVSGAEPAGFKSVYWDGQNDSGKPVTSGVYLYKLIADEFEASRKMVLVK
jgi:hypothetical protein